MQLVKNLYTRRHARRAGGYKRKIREARLAEQLENEHDKDWILDKYLNTTSPTARSAARRRSVSRRRRACTSTSAAQDLNLRQAALLAGIPQAPTDYSPIPHSQAARNRRDQVLDKMAEPG